MTSWLDFAERFPTNTLHCMQCYLYIVFYAFNHMQSLCQKSKKFNIFSHHKHKAAFIHKKPNKKEIKSFKAIFLGGRHFLHIQRKFWNIQRKICHRTNFALISSRKVVSTQFLFQIATFSFLFQETPILSTIIFI